MRHYHYVGPLEIRAAAVAAGATSGTAIRSREDLRAWLAAHPGDREGATTPVTYVVAIDGTLRIAPRRSEHVACAAGELFVDATGVQSASNLSTGFCPEPACWTALAAAIDRADLVRPSAFEYAFEFRRCPACGERNLIKDGVFECAMCDAELPALWNF